jgi:hypothetical protein
MSDLAKRLEAAARAAYYKSAEFGDKPITRLAWEHESTEARSIWRAIANAAIATIERETIERAIVAAATAKLPDGYQWGREAMSLFNFGLERAVSAIRALSPPAASATNEETLK